jgi:DNA-binding YbaB/EbfC family protein
MKNLAQLMKQASQMQQKVQELQARLESLEVTGEAGAGMVRVTLNGKSELRRVQIDPSLLKEEEASVLEDLIVAAHNDAKRHLEQVTAEEMQKLTGGLPLPAGLKLPF